MLKPFKINLFRIAVGIVIVTMGFIGADIVQHYILLKYTTNWLQHTGRRHNTFESQLNILPIGEASVDILNLVSTEKKEVIRADKVNLRKGLFDWDKVGVTAESISSSIASVKTVTATVSRSKDTDQGTILTFAPLTLQNTVIHAPVGALTAEETTAELTYTEANHKIALQMLVPNLQINNKAGLEVGFKGHSTVHRPHNGEFTLRLKGIDEFSQMLVESGMLEATKAQFLALGGQLLSDQEGNINLKLRIKNNNIYFGPFSLTHYNEQ